MKTKIFTLVILAILTLPGKAQQRKLPYLGACVSTLPRIELVPGRQFVDLNGEQIDPLAYMAQSGFKAVRVFASREISDSTPVGYPDNSGSVDHREANFMLDDGGISEQVELALRAKALGMKIILTLHFGQHEGPDSWHEYIPESWLNLTYNETLAKLDEETRRLLKPFLDAGIQPEIIIVENEADSGMLFQYVDSNGNMAIRGADDDPANVFSEVATGHYSIWPKCAGYFKRVILSAKSAISEKGLDNAYTRFAVHTTGNDWRIVSTYDRIFSQPDINETNYISWPDNVDRGIVSVIPDDIRNTRLKDLVDIMGGSVYPQPPEGTPNSLDAFKRDWGYINDKITAFGKYTSGPYEGQYKKQGLVVEFSLTNSTSEAVRAAKTKEFLDFVCDDYPWINGALWWEPHYARNNWYGGQGELFTTTDWDNSTNTYAVFKATETLPVWGAYGSDSPTSINEIKENSGSEIIIFPNPVSANEPLKIKGLSENSTICIQDLSGRILKRMKVDGDTQILLDLKPGLYTAKEENSANRKAFRFIVK